MASERKHRRRLTVVLHADVIGLPPLVQLDETLAHARVTAAFSRLSETICLYGGTVLEVRGDVLVVELDRASDAIAAALRFQSENVGGKPPDNRRRSACSTQRLVPSWLLASLASASTTSGDNHGAIKYYNQFREREPQGRAQYAI